MSLAMVVLATDIDAGLFEKPADGIWRTKFWNVGDGFSLRAVAHAPVGGRADIDYEWSPHEPSNKDHRVPDRERVDAVYRTLKLRVFIYYHLVYGFTHKGLGAGL